MKIRGWRWVLALTVIAAAVAAFVLLRKPPSDRELIEQLIIRLEESIERKQLGGIMACISQDYRDDAGLRKRDLLRLALRYVRDYGWAELLISDVDIEVQGRAAVASMYVEVTYVQGNQESTPFAGEVTAFLRKRGRRWLVVKSEGWQSAAEAAAQ